jgi:hypothetical protein
VSVRDGGDPVRTSADRNQVGKAPEGTEDGDSTAPVDRYQDVATCYGDVMRRRPHARGAAHAQAAGSHANERTAIVVGHPQAAEPEREVVRLPADGEAGEAPPRPSRCDAK